MQLKDVAVLITGGGSGLGAATARAMAAKGAKIAVLDQSKENAERSRPKSKASPWLPTSRRGSRSRPRLPSRSRHGIARVLMKLRRDRRIAAHRRQGRRLPAGQVRAIINVNLIGTFNVLRLFADAS